MIREPLIVAQLPKPQPEDQHLSGEIGDSIGAMESSAELNHQLRPTHSDRNLKKLQQ